MPAGSDAGAGPAVDVGDAVAVDSAVAVDYTVAVGVAVSVGAGVAVPVGATRPSSDTTTSGMNAVSTQIVRSRLSHRFSIFRMIKTPLKYARYINTYLILFYYILCQNAIDLVRMTPQRARMM